MTTNTDTAPIICRTLRQLDALVAEHVMGWQWWRNKSTCLFLPPDSLTIKAWGLSPSELPPEGARIQQGIDYAPHYTTWAMLGEVVAKVEAAGYWVSMEGACGIGMNPDEPDAALHPMGSTEESGYATGPSIPVALCLAALAAFGCRVQLELGGES